MRSKTEVNGEAGPLCWISLAFLNSRVNQVDIFLTLPSNATPSVMVQDSQLPRP